MDIQKELMNARVTGLGMGMIIAGCMEYTIAKYVKTPTQFCGVIAATGLAMFMFITYG